MRKQALAQGLHPWLLLGLLFQMERFNQHEQRSYVKKAGCFVYLRRFQRVIGHAVLIYANNR